MCNGIMQTYKHFQLGLALASLRVITSLVAQHMYSLPAAFIAQDFTTQTALYTHHQYIAGFIMTGAFAHGAIFLFTTTIPNRMFTSVLSFFTSLFLVFPFLEDQSKYKRYHTKPTHATTITDKRSSR